MADIGKEVTKSDSQIDFTGEHQPECMLDAEAVIAQDLHNTRIEIQYAVEEPDEDGVDGDDLLDNEDCADIFDQWYEKTQTRGVVVPATTTTQPETLELVCASAPKHFDLQMDICKNHCSRHPLCVLPNAEKLAISFAKRTLHERALEVRAMLLATSSRPGERNFLNVGSKNSASCKRLRIGNNDKPLPGSRTTVAYSIFGRRMCRAAFSAIVQLKPATISRYAQNVTCSEEFQPPVPNASKRHLGKKGIQRTLLCVFLSRYADDYGLESPTGVHSTQEMSARILPVGTTRQAVYLSYLAKWNSLNLSANADRANATKPDAELSYSALRRYWGEDMAHIRISKGGSDFCDLCTRLKDDLRRLPWADPQRMSDLQLFFAHRAEAKNEFEVYKMRQRMWKNLPLERDNANSRHFVFEFAEKVLLPRLLEQPVQLHFVICLKFDITVVSSSRTNTNHVFGLPEGHWPNDKTVNSVCSMLYHCLQLPTEREGQGGTLFLTADNCAEQNKNRFMLWFCCWLVMTGLERRVFLNFLICGPTKNVCDGSFGHVKRLLHRIDVKNPAEMMVVIQNSSTSTKCIPSVDVQWTNWKDMLREYFTVPTSFGISTYHEFSSDIEKKRVL